MCVAVPGNLALVTEHMCFTLQRRLLRERREYPMFERMKMAMDAALGLQWMHALNPPMLHRNVHLSNFLVRHLTLSPTYGPLTKRCDTKKKKKAHCYLLLHLLQVNIDGTVKISGFGFRKLRKMAARKAILSESEGRTDIDIRRMRVLEKVHLAPECLHRNKEDRRYDLKSDVYSFGLCLYEIYSSNLPCWCCLVFLFFERGTNSDFALFVDFSFKIKMHLLS